MMLLRTFFTAYCSRIVFFLCIAFLLYTAGVASGYFAWGPAHYINEQIRALTSPELDYTRDDKIGIFDENWLFQPERYLNKHPQDERFYTLFTLRYQDSIYLMNEKNQLAHRWDIPYRQAFPHFKKQPLFAPVSIHFEKAYAFGNGDLIGVYTGQGDMPYGYGLVKVDKDSNILWTYPRSTHHDFFIHPDNGNIYVLLQEDEKLPISPSLEPLASSLGDHIAILNADGKEISSFSITQAFMESPFADMFTNRQMQGAPWDRTHTNSVDVLDSKRAPYFPQFKPGSILISMRNLNTLAVIDPDTYLVVWATSGNWLTQHSAHFTDRGTIVLFDNNGGGSFDKPQSRIVEYTPATGAMKNLFAGRERRPFYSCAYGRVQPLDNGNYLVTEALSGRAFEFNAASEIVWDYKLGKHYQPYIADIAPFGGNEKNYDADKICANVNLVTAFTSAWRYRADQLPFLQEKLQ